MNGQGTWRRERFLARGRETGTVTSSKTIGILNGCPTPAGTQARITIDRHAYGIPEGTTEPTTEVTTEATTEPTTEVNKEVNTEELRGASIEETHEKTPGAMQVGPPLDLLDPTRPTLPVAHRPPHPGIILHHVLVGQVHLLSDERRSRRERLCGLSKGSSSPILPRRGRAAFPLGHAVHPQVPRA